MPTSLLSLLLLTDRTPPAMQPPSTEPEHRQRLSALDAALTARAERAASECGNPAEYIEAFKVGWLSELVLQLCDQDSALLEKLEARFVTAP